MPEFINVGKVFMYADDTSIVVSARSPEDLILNVEKAASQFKCWCSKNRLIVNVDKTRCLNFHLKPINYEI